MGQFLLEDKSPEEKTCKGLYWRGKVSLFFSSHNSIENRKSLRFLKRMSCNGCGSCDWLWDIIREDADCQDDIINHVEDGKLYTFKVHTSRDWESGHYEVDETEFAEVMEN